MKPSSWIIEHMQHLKAGSTVLDLACGKGRHTALLLDKGFRVCAVDIDTEHVTNLTKEYIKQGACEIVSLDLEKSSEWPLTQKFNGIIVTNYLHRPIMQHIADALLPGGVLIYQTFMQGNEAFGKPSNPKFLLEEDELKNTFGQGFELIAFSQGEDNNSVKQQICVRKI